MRQNGKLCPPGFWYRDEGGYSSWGSIEPISFDGGSHQCWGRFEAKNRCLPSLSHFSQAGIHLSLHSSKIRGLCLMKLSSEMLEKFTIFFISSNFGFCNSWFPSPKLLEMKNMVNFSNISLDNFIKHKPLISEECL